MKAVEDGSNLLDACMLDPEIIDLVSEAELVELFDPRGHLGVCLLYTSDAADE